MPRGMSIKNLMRQSSQYLSKQLLSDLNIKKHVHHKEESPPNRERSAKYDYKDLMKANVNLIDIIDSGGNVHFDCPPINFNQIDYNKIPENELSYF